MEQKIGKKNSWIVSFKIVSFVSSCRNKKVFFAIFPSFFLLHPHLPPLRHCPSIRGKSKKKKAPLQQYALPPALRRGRQKPRNQRRAHVTSHCAPLSCGLPALACFLAEVIVNQPTPSPPPPPPTPTTKLARLWGGNAHILPHTWVALAHT